MGVREGIASGVRRKDWKDLTLEEVERLILKSHEEEDPSNGLIGVRISLVRFKRYKDISSAIYSLKRKLRIDNEEVERVKKELKEEGYSVLFVAREYYGNIYLELLYVKVNQGSKAKAEKLVVTEQESKPKS